MSSTLPFDVATIFQPPVHSLLFPQNSRYYGIETARAVRVDGTVVIYLRRRFAPSPGSLATSHFQTVVEGDRLDRLAAAYLGDPEQFWQICDANAAMRPDELTETIGRPLRITLPRGM
jgi:hypothetical protein